MAPRGKEGVGGRDDANDDRRECAYLHPDDERRYRRRSRVGDNNVGSFLAPMVWEKSSVGFLREILCIVCDSMSLGESVSRTWTPDCIDRGTK